MWSSYHVRVPGKWVLAGEHSVLKGASAIAIPHPTFALELTFQPQIWAKDEPHLKILPERAISVVLQILSRMESLKGSQGKGRLVRPTGSLLIESSIPVGAGLGSSAALCVAMTKWAAPAFGISDEEVFGFARSLEDQFHGRSSGMDVAATAAGEVIRFSMAKGPEPMGVSKLPRFTFHDTGLRARTSECVVKVESFRAEQVKESERWDRQMGRASEVAEEGLLQFDAASAGNDRVGTEQALLKVSESMNLARECFEAWDLIPESVKILERGLREQGALATKLTGAGGGGFVVALWND